MRADCCIIKGVVRAFIGVGGSGCYGHLEGNRRGFGEGCFVFFFVRFFVDFVLGNLEGLPGVVVSSRGAENTITFSGGTGRPRRGWPISLASGGVEREQL